MHVCVCKLINRRYCRTIRFPPFLRAHVQAGLTHAWNFCLPPLQASSPAALVAETLRRTLGDDGAARYTYIDFCAGAGGPTPDIERALNQRLLRSPSSSSSSSSVSAASSNGAPSYAAVASTEPSPRSRGGKKGAAAAGGTKGGSGSGGEDDNNGEGVRFVLTDLHPHVAEWEAACRRSEHLSYIAEPVDASDAPAELIARHAAPGRKVFRLYNLAFHHFDDGLARAMLKNTVETSDGFGYVASLALELPGYTLSSPIPSLFHSLAISTDPGGWISR